MTKEKIIFFIPLKKIPTVTSQQKKINTKNKTVYKSKSLQEAESLFRSRLVEHIPTQKMEGPIRLTTVWCFPVTSKTKHLDYKITKPDTDNLIKLFKDCMTALGYWKDDALVAEEITTKIHSKNVGISVIIEELEKNVIYG